MKNMGKVVTGTSRNADGEPLPTQVWPAAMDMDKILNPPVLGQTPPSILPKPARRNTRRGSAKSVRRINEIGLNTNSFLVWCSKCTRQFCIRPILWEHTSRRCLRASERARKAVLKRHYLQENKHFRTSGEWLRKESKGLSAGSARNLRSMLVWHFGSPKPCTNRPDKKNWIWPFLIQKNGQESHWDYGSFAWCCKY